MNEREARIQELEQRLARRPAIGIKPQVAVLAILGAVVLLWLQRQELAYFVSPREPLVLGREGEYAFDRLDSNRYVRVHGIPTVRGASSHERGGTYVVVGLRDTPLLIRRRAFPSEEWRQGGTPPQPDQRPFAVGGRLLAQRDAERYSEGFAQLERMGEVVPRDGTLWIVVADDRPGEDWSVPLIAGLLLAFIGVNGWFLVRGLRALATARRGAPPPA